MKREDRGRTSDEAKRGIGNGRRKEGKDRGWERNEYSETSSAPCSMLRRRERYELKRTEREGTVTSFMVQEKNKGAGLERKIEERTEKKRETDDPQKEVRN